MAGPPAWGKTFSQPRHLPATPSALADVVFHLPLASAALWLVIAVVPWARGLRNAPERAFAWASLLIALGAVADWGFLHAGDEASAILLLNLRNSLFSLVVLAIFYFGRWLARPRGTLDVFAVLPVLGTLGIVWTGLTTGADPVDGVWEAHRDPLRYFLWVFQIVGYFFASMVYISASLRRATFTTPATRKKLVAILASFLLALLTWGAVAAWRVLTATPGPGISTQLLLIPGAIVLPFLAPIRSARAREVLHRLMVSPSRPFAALMFHNAGPPLAQVVLPGEKSMEAGTLSDLAAAVDHVLSQGLKSGGALRRIRHGEHFFEFERGKHVTVAVVLRGSPSEGLRSQLRLAVEDFESTHGERLASWETASELAEQALAVLDQVLRPTSL